MGAFGSPPDLPPPPPPVAKAPEPDIDESALARRRKKIELARRGRQSLVIDPPAKGTGLSIPR